MHMGIIEKVVYMCVCIIKNIIYVCVEISRGSGRLKQQIHIDSHSELWKGAGIRDNWYQGKDAAEWGQNGKLKVFKMS